MSIETWKEEFYPEKFPDTDDNPTTETVLKALDHSIRKWSGTSSKNLKRHGVEFFDLTLKHKDSKNDNFYLGDFLFNAGSCALCSIFFLNKCNGCPLSLIDDCCMDDGSTYQTIEDEMLTPLAMVKALKMAKREYIKSTKESKVNSDKPETIPSTDPLYPIIQQHFNKIDDYYEAKEELINRINQILKLDPWGDADGVVCQTKINDKFKKICKLVDDL